MAMNGTQIVAYPGTVTGSIGVVFGKPNLHGLYDKLGVDKDSISRGRFAAIDSDYRPLDDAERAKLREGIDQHYRSFVQKVADSRKRPFDQIEPVAQGRVWLGDQAKENGLVDELGGIDRAIELVKLKASIGAGETVSLVTYPARRSLLEMLLSTPPPDATIESRIASVVHYRSAGVLPSLLQSPAMRAWMHGGYLSLSPWSFTIE
jgi:protease-4